MQHRGCGRGLQEVVGTARGAVLSALTTSADRWGWVPGAQRVFQLGDPPTLGSQGESGPKRGCGGG